MSVEVTITRAYRDPNFFSNLNPQSGYGFYKGGISGGGSTISSHNQLQGLQGGGGTPAAYYHLNFLQYEELVVLLDQLEMDSAHNQVESITLYGNIYFNNEGESSGGHLENFIYWGDTGDIDTYIHEYTDDVLRVICDNVLTLTITKDDLTVTGDNIVTGSIQVDTITEYTATAGVTIEYVELKDGGITTQAAIQSDGNLYLDTHSDVSHVDRQIAWGDGNDWDTYIIEMDDDVLRFYAGGNEAFRITSSGFQMGVVVDTIETTLTDDDTHLPTSGAVYDAIASIDTGYWDRSSAGVLTTDTAGDDINLEGDLYFNIANGPQISNLNPSATVPNIHTSKTDLTTGLGRYGAGYVSIICSGTEIFRVGSTSIKAMQEIAPDTTGNIDLGTSSLYWQYLYVNNAGNLVGV